MIPRSASTSPPTGFLGLALVAVLVLGALPFASATSATGAWVFPTAHRSAAVADTLADTFYTGDSENPWLQDSYFADSLADSASVSVDLYNPTGATLYNVQVFAAYSIDNLDLVTSISFSGGDSGSITYSGDDLTSGGTPSMSGGVAIDAHDVYPAYFVSYGVGDLSAGSSNIRSITVAVVGDFANGLIVHLDYTAEDASGNGVSGPFTADMNIFENGDTEEPPACTDGDLHLSGSLSSGTYKAGNITFEAKLTLASPFEYDRSPVKVTLKSGSVKVTGASQGTLSQGTWTWTIDSLVKGQNVSANLTLQLPSLAIDGDIFVLSATATWETCDGGADSDMVELAFVVSLDPTGDVHSASWWEEQAEKTNKGKKKAEFNTSEFDLLLQRVALHSNVFTFGSWKGTAPTGDKDAGWVDIGSLALAIKVFDKKTDESKKVRGAEREDLALWLNVVSGGINLDTALEVYEKKHHGHGHSSEFEDETALKSLASSLDTPGEIVAFLEKQIKDWSDGHGSSKADLKLARRLARSVNSEWLVAA